MRVQNVRPEGLSLEDCRYINHETHNELLERSQVHEHDLITKITGVGRMAVSAVAPESFQGNINQHLVVIETKSRIISETLAAFLNTDIGETLASRRSTGGTRPALDYAALKSIPIVYLPKIVEIMKGAYEAKSKKEQEAERLLESIDSVVLEALSIGLPVEEEVGLEQRISHAPSNRVFNSRFDPEYYNDKFIKIEQAMQDSKYPTSSLQEVTAIITSGKTPARHDYTDSSEGKPIIKVGSNSNKFIDLKKVRVVVQSRMISRL